MPRDFSQRSKHFNACRSCAERSENCHSGCKEYAKEVIFGIILEGEAKKVAAKREIDYDVHERRAVRISNTCPSAKKAMRKNGYMRHRGGR